MTLSEAPAEQETAAGIAVSDVREDAFIEQAEYINEAELLAWSAEHPDEESIIRKLSLGGAKLLVGPRGCGKTTLMLKAYYQMLRGSATASLPLYVNFKLSLRLEPLYVNTPNASFWFQRWLVLKIYEALYKTVGELGVLHDPSLIPEGEVARSISLVEAGRTGEVAWDSPDFTIEGLSSSLRRVLALTGRARAVLLLDDAAHAFSPKQQEDFFEFFRQIKSRDVAPKAAIYPGITTHSPNFHVGHDAEQIDVWLRPDATAYLEFMRSLVQKRFDEKLAKTLLDDKEAMDFLAFASFGAPRSFLNMVRSLHQTDGAGASQFSTDKRRLLDAAKQSRESAHNVYESLTFKLPAYANFVRHGDAVYNRIIAAIKVYNKDKPEKNQAVEAAIKRPVPAEMAKVFSFFQYAGLLMPIGENSRGVKGVFEIYMVHFGDLITENAIIGKRTKNLSSFVAAFKAQTHQAWPRVTPDRLAGTDDYGSLFRLSLPHCQTCGSERASEHARFCQSCGAQLKTASLYDQLISQDISVLNLTGKRTATIKKNSNIRTIKDILIDSSRQELRSVPYIGPVWAERIARYAEEHVA